MGFLLGRTTRGNSVSSLAVFFFFLLGLFGEEEWMLNGVFHGKRPEEDFSNGWIYLSRRLIWSAVGIIYRYLPYGAVLNLRRNSKNIFPAKKRPYFSTLIPQP
jgi:hypothetical protein